MIRIVIAAAAAIGMLLVALSSMAQSGHNTTLLFYNAENLFHPSDDSLKSDEEFTPAGVRHWTYKRYHAKIARLAKVIHAAGGWEPPAMVGLCEVENEKVLKDLVFHPVLVNYGYHILHAEGPDPRGIDVALLFRHERVKVLDTAFITVRPAPGERPMRDILEALVQIGRDSCMVRITHWPSKYSGAAETEPLRLRAAVLLAARVDSVSRACPGLPQVIAGDFNDPSDAASILCLTTGGGITEVVPGGHPGTYKYRGRWSFIDHVFVAGDVSGITTAAEVFAPCWLLTEDERYTGMKPFRTYTGYRYSGGFSDHLPVLLHLHFRAGQGDGPVRGPVRGPFRSSGGRHR